MQSSFINQISTLMKKFVLFVIMFTMIAPIFAQQEAADIWVPGDQSTPPQTIQNIQRGATDLPSNPVLYDNGPIVTHPGGGFGGADVSVLQNNLLMNTYGFGHQVSMGYWVADDFTVPAGGWTIAGFGFYAYQTYSTTTSTFTAVHLKIFDGDPSLPGSNLIFGDGTTNRMTSSDFTNIYRVLDNNMIDYARPVFQNSCMFDLFLPAGTYWVAWQSDGTLSSGPWANPIAILGQTTTGNALQTLDNGTTWNPAKDIGTNTAQGFPFLIYGTVDVVPLSNWALLIGIGLILTFAIIRFRRIA